MQERNLNWHWNGYESKHISEEFDPATGVRTHWEKTNNGLLSKREESLSGLHRYGLSVGPSWLTSSIYGRGVDGIYRHIEVTQPQGEESITVRLSDSQERVGDIFTKYDHEGKFRSVNISVSGSMTEDTPNIQDFMERPFGQNFSDLTQIIKFRGLVVLTTAFQFGYEEDQAIEKELETNKQMAANWMMQRGWEPEIVDEIARDTQTLLEPVVDYAFGNELSPENKKILFKLIERDALNLLPDNYHNLTREGRFSELKRNIEHSVAMALDYYYQRPNMLDNYFVEMRPASGEDQDKFSIFVTDSLAPNAQVLSEAEVSASQTHRYESNDFSIRIKDGKVIISVRPLLNSQPGGLIELPEHIDSEQIIRLTRIDENVDLEKALELVQANIS